MKPQGIFYISIPFVYPVHDAPHDFRRYTAYGLRELLIRHGFHIEYETTHGNSYVVSMQLINLSLLETARYILTKNKIIGLIFSCIIYPVCIGINFLSITMLLFKFNNAICFGHFVKARSK